MRCTLPFRFVVGLSLSALMFSALIFSTPRICRAAGYELLEQSGAGVGTAYAGISTGIGDGSEVFYNPAAMTRLESNTASLSVHLIMPHAQFENNGSSLAPQLGGSPLTGNMGGDAGSLSAVPNLYGTYKATDEVTFGLGINSPFGLSSEYNDTWVGRYQAVKSELLTVNINPAVGVKLNEMFSVGANMQIMYADAKLSNAVDFGSIGTATLGPQTAGQLGLLPQQADGFATVKGDDWGVGFGLGGTFSPTEDLTFGVNWRSRIKMTLSGSADFDVPPNAAPLTSTGLFTDSDADATVTLPEEINFGMAAKLDPQWTLYGDATWIRWSRFQELRVTFDSPQPDSVQEESWDNTWRFSLGAKYRPCEPWTFRGGFAYDASPTSDADYRTPRIPDNDRYWMAFGVDYDLTEDTTIGFSYAHLFIPDADTDTTTTTGANLDGSFDLGVEIASFNVVTRFR